MKQPARYPWDTFPPVWIHAGESAVKQHASYSTAKARDPDSAYNLISDTLSPVIVKRLMNAFWTISPILVSAHAVEGAGVNAIPETLADILAKQLNWRVDSGVVQTNIVAHTGADGFSRLARQAVFDGDVIPNEHYLLVDDFVGQGGTLANLRAHIIRGGGIVLGATVLTGKQHSANLALRDSTIEARADFQLELEFNTGETRIFDARPYLEKGIFRQLQDVTLFKQAYVAFDTVCWPGEIDIAPETLYDRSISVS